jgi:hypothetical protein
VNRPGCRVIHSALLPTLADFPRHLLELEMVLPEIMPQAGEKRPVRRAHLAAKLSRQVTDTMKVRRERLPSCRRQYGSVGTT